MLPLHPFMAHIPLVLALCLPIVLVSSIVFIMKKKISPRIWWLPVVVQITIVIFSYIALETGEAQEDTVLQFVAKPFVQQHENAAEIFSGLGVILLGLMVVVLFVGENLARNLRFLTAALSLIPLAAGLYAGRLGGAIAYTHGGAEAYYQVEGEEQHGILPTPGMNTSESEFPIDELELNNPDQDVDEEGSDERDNVNTEVSPEDESLPENEENRSN